MIKRKTPNYPVLHPRNRMIRPYRNTKSIFLRTSSPFRGLTIKCDLPQYHRMPTFSLIRDLSIKGNVGRVVLHIAAQFGSVHVLFSTISCTTLWHTNCLRFIN